MQLPQDSAQLRRQRMKLMHKALLILSAVLSALCMLGSFFVLSRLCQMSFFLWYCLYYLGQAIQHFLSFIIPSIDVVKYSPLIRRFVGVVVVTDLLYFFLAFTFWTKSEVHPLYCLYCHRLHFSPLFGILLIVHSIVSLFFFVHFLYAYIKRKYYLISLGGFALEQRLLQEREEGRRRIGMLEPMNNDYPMPLIAGRNKYYVFEDLEEGREGPQICSICLNPNSEGGQSIMTTCKHVFHRACIQSWAKINSKCPQCRREFQQVLQPPQPLPKHLQGDLAAVLQQAVEQQQQQQPRARQQQNGVAQ